jgi:hypothetical protein
MEEGVLFDRLVLQPRHLALALLQSLLALHGQMDELLLALCRPYAVVRDNVI